MPYQGYPFSRKRIHFETVFEGISANLRKHRVHKAFLGPDLHKPQRTHQGMAELGSVKELPQLVEH